MTIISTSHPTPTISTASSVISQIFRPTNVNLLLIIGINCLSGMPIEADLLESGYNLETALQQVNCIAQRDMPLPVYQFWANSFIVCPPYQTTNLHPYSACL